eukprot:COSAG01_NODE_2885_length_6901_cov_101.837028_1_plen_167_part_00
MPALGGGTQGGGGGGGGGAEYLSCVFESPRARPLRLAAFQDWLASGWGRHRLLRVKGFVSFFEEGGAAEEPAAAAARSRPVRFLFHGSGRQRFELRPEAEGGDGGGGAGDPTVAADDLAVQLVLIGESHGLDGAAAALEAACAPPRPTIHTAGALGGAEMDVLVRD